MAGAGRTAAQQRPDLHGGEQVARALRGALAQHAADLGDRARAGRLRQGAARAAAVRAGQLRAGCRAPAGRPALCAPARSPHTRYAHVWHGRRTDVHTLASRRGHTELCIILVHWSRMSRLQLRNWSCLNLLGKRPRLVQSNLDHQPESIPPEHQPLISVTDFHGDGLHAKAHPVLLAVLLARGTMRSLSAPLAPRDIAPRTSGLSSGLPPFMEPSISACKAGIGHRHASL